jgi:ATP-binding cassette, subfamily C (CFTR/MRP), member 4
MPFFEGGMSLNDAIKLGILIAFCIIFSAILHHPYYWTLELIGFRMRLGLSGLIYRKLMKLNIKEMSSNQTADVINLISTDIFRIEPLIQFYPYLFVGPIQTFILIGITIIFINPSFLMGLVCLSIIILQYSILSRLYSIFRNKACKLTDNRVSLLKEILNNIKIIKMYCWEKPFSEKIEAIRNKELLYQLYWNILTAIAQSINNILGTVMTMVNVITFLFFLRKASLIPVTLDPGIVVLSIGLYTRLATSIGSRFTESLSCLVNSKVSFDRINRFLLLDEINVHDKSLQIEQEQENEGFIPEDDEDEDDDENENEDNKESSNVTTKQNETDDYSVIVEHFNYKWSLNSQFSLKEINFKIKKDNFLAIVGPVGSGKTSLLLGLLGELENYSGKINTRGRIYHVSQQPWIFSASVKQNILFGMEYNEDKFNKIVDVCSLRKVFVQKLNFIFH